MDMTSVSIAVAVVMIASFQLRFAQHRAARGLFDREVVAALQRSSRAATSKNGFKFLRTAFLFDREIIRELKLFHKAISEVCVSLAENDAVAKREWRDVAPNGFYNTLQPLLARYLRIKNSAQLIGAENEPQRGAGAHVLTPLRRVREPRRG
jgi:hypothetical protein